MAIKVYTGHWAVCKQQERVTGHMGNSEKKLQEWWLYEGVNFALCWGLESRQVRGLETH